MNWLGVAVLFFFFSFIFWGLLDYEQDESWVLGAAFTATAFIILWTLG
jgi:Kef-type K+ transport system membrane component KefB